MKHRFSTATWTGGRVLDGWRSWLAHELHPVDVTGYDEEHFHAECEVAPLGEVELVTFQGSPQGFVRRQSAIRSFNSDNYVVSLTKSAPAIFDHNGYHVRCGDGDIMLLDTGRPYEVAHQSDVRITSIVVPRKHLESRLAAATTAAGLTLDGRSATAKLIRGYLGRLMQDAEALEPSATRRLSLIAVDLIAAGFEERLAHDQPRRNRRGAIIARAQAFIEDNLSDPELDLQRVADLLKMSPRTLYAIFATEQMSATDYLWERRLLRARELLIGDVQGVMPISSIAYRVGFKNPAHFARRFKERFGTSATELRKQLQDR